MKVSPPVRIAVAGAGLIGQAHIRALATLPQAALCGIADPAPAARDLAGSLGVPWFRDVEALLARARPDGVVLATPNSLHVPQALQCLAAGVPALVEKPLATTLTEAQKLMQVAEGGKVALLVGHHRAHSPIMARACEVVRSGQLGRLVGVMGSAVFFKPEEYFREAPWRREPGGGPILINLIHEVHSLRMLCGDIVAVQAFVSNTTRAFAVEDTVAINLRFASGALGTFLLSDTAACARSWEQTSQENPVYPSYADEDCYVIAGTLGSLSVPTMRIKRYPDAQGSSWWKPFEVGVVDVVREDPLLRQMAHFVQVVQGTGQPLVTARDGFENLRVTDAILRAAAGASAVELQAV